MRIGFTGTRRGMSGDQLTQLLMTLSWLVTLAIKAGDLVAFHHGDCHDPDGGTSSDHQAALMAVAMGAVEKIHAPEKRTPTSLLARNRDIVAASDILIAAPETDEEQLRSGTWATIRYARAKGIPIVMLSRGKA